MSSGGFPAFSPFGVILLTIRDAPWAMKQLPIRGATVVTPSLGEDELKQALSQLGVIAVYSDADVRKLHLELAALYGAWIAEQESKKILPVARALLKTGKSLNEASCLLNGHATGFRTQTECEVTSQVIAVLGLNPTVHGSERAREIIERFQADAAQVSEACLIAYADLTRKAANEGRPREKWYDDFTAILLRIAKKAGINPNLNKDRVSKKRGGWLFAAAQALEPFLDRHMRSISAEACGKRLERSRKQLSKAHRQNPHPR